MAVFGRDFYGLTKYGANVYTEFDVNPFDANPEGYGSIRVTWHSPSGSWTNIRLLRSRNGYAVDENDGYILVDSTSPVDHYVDQDLAGGNWYYYTIFVKNADGWNRAGATSSLAVKKPWTRVSGEFLDPAHYDTSEVEYGYADVLWQRVPAYFRWIRRDNAAITDEYYVDPNKSASVFNPALYDYENQHLRLFIETLGWGLDYIHNYGETLLWANDPKKAHLSDVDKLAQELGVDFEYGIPAATMRSKVLNAALLARRRGTLQGLQDVVALSTGWNVDIEVNQNLFLNRDQSEFANPIYNEWDPGINYATGQKAQFEGRIVTALKGAYGNAERPPYTGEGTSNTYWQVTTDADVTTLHNPTYDSVVTWKAFQDGTTPKTPNLASGISSPFDSTTQESNALAIRNTDTVAHTYDVLGASNLAGDTTVLPEPPYAVRQGLPIPHILLWDPETEYELGQYVVHYGASWRSIGTSLGEEPQEGSLYWEKVGIDERPLLAYSFYAHGNDSSGGVAVTPGLAFFDDKGALLSDLTTVTVSNNLFFDTFNNEPGTKFDSRNPDFTWSGEKWTTESGEWAIGGYGSDDQRVAYPLSATGVTTVQVPVGLTQYRVAATFFKAPPPGRTDSLVLRYSGGSYALKVTRTGVKDHTGASVLTLTTPITDGDRVTVVINDNAETWNLLVNGTSVGSGTFPAATGPFNHGMMME